MACALPQSRYDSSDAFAFAVYHLHVGGSTRQKHTGHPNPFIVRNSHFPGPHGIPDFPPPLDDKISRKFARDQRGEAQLWGLMAPGTKAQARSQGERRARVGAQLRQALMECEVLAVEQKSVTAHLAEELTALRRRNDALERELNRRVKMETEAAATRQQQKPNPVENASS